MRWLLQPYQRALTLCLAVGCAAILVTVTPTARSDDFAAVGSGVVGSGVVRSTGVSPIVLPNCRLRVVHDVQLASERSGILAYVVPAGSYVKAGTTVAHLRDSVARASLAIAEKEAADDIEIRFARKATEVAQINYERMRQANLALAGTVSDLELREARLAAEKTLLQLEQAELQFAVAALRHHEQLETIKTYQVTAPFDAFVRQVHKKQGEVVGEGEVVLEVVNTEHMRVDGFIDVAQLSQVHPGSPVRIRLSSNNTTPSTQQLVFSGRIEFVDVKVEPVSQKVRVWAEVQNRDRLLRDGLIATMEILPMSRPVGSAPQAHRPVSYSRVE